MNGWPAQVTWSQDRKYRYVWRLSWDPKKRPLLVAALIPSYADETRADRTVRYCLDVAAGKGYGELVVVNMFARYHTPRHKQADRVDVFDLVGKDNDQHISAEARVVSEKGGTVVAAWGSGRLESPRARAVAALRARRRTLVLRHRGQGRPNRKRVPMPPRPTRSATRETWGRGAEALLLVPAALVTSSRAPN